MWNVGSGFVVRIRIDPWLGCKWRHVLLAPMIDKLHDAGFSVLKDIACLGIVLLQDQGWLHADLFGFVEQEIIIWNNYVALLISSHVRISNEDDQLVWSYSKTGKYTPKAGYFYLIEDRNDLDYSWWWKWLWKLNCPLKSKLYCWFLFSGKVLT